MTYRIYNHNQKPRKDGAEYLTTASYISKDEFESIKQELVTLAKKVCLEKGWNYADMVHEDRMNVIGRK